jgi:hypothetical protein
MLTCEIADIAGRRERDLLKDKTNETFTKLNSVALSHKRTIQTERPSSKVVPTFADRGCCVGSATDPHCRILGFLDSLETYTKELI